MNDPAPTNAKQAALALIGALPESVTWDELVYELAVRRAVERGLADVEAGRVVDASEVERELFAR
jgi:predicted transcriptional regulator